jgi:hypothetical protein
MGAPAVIDSLAPDLLLERYAPIAVRAFSGKNPSSSSMSHPEA